jgi:hypothetical protein
VPRLVSNMGGPDGAAQFNAMLDRQLAAMAQPGLLQRLIGATGPERSPEQAARLAEKDALFRRMLGTLLVTQGFRELPVETQLDPAVQERMWSHMDEIGATVFEVTDTLAALDEPQRAQLRSVLGQRKDLPMEVGEVIDAQAASAGISGARRMQLRSMMSQTSFRLRHGDPGSIIDEYVEKVARMKESTERHGDALRIAKQLGERSFWRYQHLLAQEPGVPQPGASQPQPQPPPIAPPPVQVPPAQPAPAQPAPAQPAPAQPAPAPGPMQPWPGQPGPPSMQPQPVVMQPPPPARRPGSRGLRVGGVMLGIGVVVFGVSALLVDGGSGGALVGLTVGALLFSIGLITILISAIIMAASD